MWSCDFLPRKTTVAFKHRAISRQEKMAFSLPPPSGCLGTPLPLPLPKHEKIAILLFWLQSPLTLRLYLTHCYYWMKMTWLKEARNSFFDLGVYLLKSKFRIDDKLRFPWYYTTFSTYDQSLFFHWFPSNNCHHSNGNGQPLILNNLEYLEN